MKNKRTYLFVGIILFGLLSITILHFFRDHREVSNYKDNTSSISTDINTDDDDEKIDWSLYETMEYELSKSLNITKEGIYHLTGIIEDGLVTVNTNGNVKLILDGVSIKNSSGPAIYVEEAENVVITTIDGTTNSLEDASNYQGYDSDVVGTIFSHDDLILDGEGILKVTSNCEDAIVSKDDLKIIQGTYQITSSDDGIRGKDSVYIKDGNFVIQSKGDGIKATNDTDSEKGFILIENGTFSINASLDGIQAETKLLIQNGTFDITTGSGSSITSSHEEWGRFGSSNSSDGSSAKGIKAGDNLVIENGSFTIDSSDDAIHCNNYLGIKNGVYQISSGDDGIHADTQLIIDGGQIDITQSYEGLESASITINSGNISIVSSDDGINVAGGNDASAMNRPGQNSFSESSNYVLMIRGGTIYVNASGDGLDSNGSIYMYDGSVTVDGPTNSGNGALDYDREFVIYGGTLIAGGASGMAQGVSSASSIYSVLINFTSNYGNSDTITITDSNNQEIISYHSAKSYSSLVVASPELKNENTYTIKVNGDEYQTFTISSITTNVGNMGMMGGMKGNPGDPGSEPNRHSGGGPGADSSGRKGERPRDY